MAPLLLIGAALGGAAMYLFDPDRGRRRRALLRDQAVKKGRKLTELLNAGTRDLANRRAAATRQLRSPSSSAVCDDDVLVERVRAKMGRYVSHPAAVEVSSAEGRVTLRGPILAYEHAGLVKALRGVSGVKELVDEMVQHEAADGIPALQGGRMRHGEHVEVMQDTWAPGARTVAAASGAMLLIHGLRNKGIEGALALGGGAALLLRSTINKPFRQLVGVSRHRGIDVRESIQIYEPVERVFEFLERYENFPHFMRNVRSVEKRPNGQSHWVVNGPAGSTVEWDSITTKLEPNRHIGWRTLDKNLVQHAGMINVEPFGGGTRVHVRMSYDPPAGVLGHGVAKLLGADPQTQLREDLLRLKSRLETGKTPHDTSQRPGAQT